MKKTLVALGLLMTVVFGAQQSFAACPCAQPCPSPCPVETPCPPPPCPVATPCPCPEATPCNPCDTKCKSCEDWLSRLESYYCRIGFNECQKDQARCAVNQFLCDIKCLNITDNNCGCESKCDCRAYKRALKNLDCEMKKIITKCQKSDYKCVKKEVKDQVACFHKCLIWPFSLCNCNCKSSPCKCCK